MTEPKRPRFGLMLVMVAVGAGLAGYLLGRSRAEPEHPARPGPNSRVASADPWADLWDDEGEEDGTGLAEFDEDAASPGAAAGPAAGESEQGEPLSLSQRFDALKRSDNPDRSQKMLVGLVADAARRGAAALPELRELLESGEDITLSSFDGKGPGYPSLRVALLAAAEATGDPAAASLIAEVASTSESPVEVVFIADLLDRLDALDAATAQRTFEALSGTLSIQEKKAMASIVGKVVPAAAAADPIYAEQFIVTQLRITDGPRADPRIVAPALLGLPQQRAREIVLDSVMAPDIDVRTKSMLASRAAQHSGTKMLTDLRAAIESSTLDAKVTSSIARSAVSGRPYSSMERTANKAVKAGDLEEAMAVTRQYEARLAEARLTIAAARTSGARVPAELNKRASIYTERLAKLKKRIYRERQKREK